MEIKTEMQQVAEKITELEDRVATLERENTILKSNLNLAANKLSNVSESLRYQY